MKYENMKKAPLIFILLSLLLIAGSHYLGLHKKNISLIFLSSVLAFQLYESYKIKTASRLGKGKLFTFKSKEWMYNSLFPLLYMYLILQEKDWDLLTLSACMLLLLATTVLLFFRGLTKNYLIGPDGIYDIKKNKLTGREQIVEIENTGDALIIHTGQYRNHFHFLFPGLKHGSREELLSELAENESVVAG